MVIQYSLHGNLPQTVIPNRFPCVQFASSLAEYTIIYRVIPSAPEDFRTEKRDANRRDRPPPMD